MKKNPKESPNIHKIIRKHYSEIGKIGGERRMASISKEQRQELGRKGGLAAGINRRANKKSA